MRAPSSTHPRLLLIISAVFLTAGCASAPPAAEEYGFEAAYAGKGPSLRWRAALDVPVSAIALARGGGAVFVATGATADRPGSVIKFGASGGLEWERAFDFPVRWASASPDGRFVSVSTEDGALHGLNEDGTVIWTVREACRPHVIARSGGRVICYREDRVSREHVLQVFDLLGERVHTYSNRGRPAVFAVSDDERHVAVGFTGGFVHLLGPDFKLERRFKVRGEVIDLVAAAGDSPRVVVLYHIGTRMIGSDVRLAAFDSEGKAMSAIDVRLPVTRISSGLVGRSVFLYGNGPQGQHLARYVLLEKEGLVRRWSLAHSVQGNHLGKPLPVSEGESVVFAFDDVLFGIGPEGHVHWEQRLESENGAYILEGIRSPAPGSHPLAVAVTDRGVVKVYELP